MANRPHLPLFRMPAEWAPHAATLVAWPHQIDDWPGKFAPIPWVYGEIVRRLADSEPVILLMPNGGKKRVTGLLKKVGCVLHNVTMLSVPTDRVWMRDSGPIAVAGAKNRRYLLDWGFNGWAKYDNWKLDDRVPIAVAKHLGDSLIEPKHDGRRVVLEGGGIDVNGDGLLLTTEEWLLSNVQVRNPGLTREDYEQVFSEYLGVTNTIWLGRGIAGDDTHGHVDDVSRFVAPRTVVTVVEPDESDPNHEPLRENLETLRGYRDDDGRLDVIELPMPGPLYFEGRRLPASYANFYVANSVVLVPTFNDPNDRTALGVLAAAFPSRRVIGIHSVDLVWGLGTLHCLTQQIPTLS